MYKKRYNAKTGSLYKWDAEHDGYIWVARSRKQTAAEAVQECEAGQQYENMLARKLNAWEIMA